MSERYTEFDQADRSAVPDQSVGILSEKQREFLKMHPEERKAEYSRQQRSYYRKRIKEQVQRSFGDYSVLYCGWEIEDYERAWRCDNPDALLSQLSGAITFMYLMLCHRDEPVEYARRRMTNTFETGLELALSFRGVESPDVTATYEVETGGGPE